MRTFQAIAVTIMAAFFVWLLLQMSRTPEADRRLLMLAIAFGGIIAALLLAGALSRIGRRGRHDS